MPQSKQPITDASLATVGSSLANAAAAIAELIRQEGQAGVFKDYQEHMHMEVLRLRGEGQMDLADAVAALAEAERGAGNE